MVCTNVERSEYEWSWKKWCDWVHYTSNHDAWKLPGLKSSSAVCWMKELQTYRRSSSVPGAVTGMIALSLSASAQLSIWMDGFSTGSRKCVEVDDSLWLVMLWWSLGRGDKDTGPAVTLFNQTSLNFYTGLWTFLSIFTWVYAKCTEHAVWIQCSDFVDSAGGSIVGHVQLSLGTFLFCFD